MWIVYKRHNLHNFTKLCNLCIILHNLPADGRACGYFEDSRGYCEGTRSYGHPRVYRGGYLFRMPGTERKVLLVHGYTVPDQQDIKQNIRCFAGIYVSIIFEILDQIYKLC